MKFIFCSSLIQFFIHEQKIAMLLSVGQPDFPQAHSSTVLNSQMCNMVHCGPLLQVVCHDKSATFGCSIKNGSVECFRCKKRNFRWFHFIVFWIKSEYRCKHFTKKLKENGWQYSVQQMSKNFWLIFSKFKQFDSQLHSRLQFSHVSMFCSFFVWFFFFMSFCSISPDILPSLKTLVQFELFSNVFGAKLIVKKSCYLSQQKFFENNTLVTTELISKYKYKVSR